MGAGMWGTTFAQVLCDAGTPAMLWGRRPELVATINDRHENPDYLPGIMLPPVLTATADPARALQGAGSWCWPCPPRRCAVISGLARPAARRRRAGQPDEGHRAGHP